MEWVTFLGCLYGQEQSLLTSKKAVRAAMAGWLHVDQTLHAWWKPGYRAHPVDDVGATTAGRGLAEKESGFN